MNILSRLFLVIFFILLGTLIYSNTFQSSFHLDDVERIVTNTSIRNINNLAIIWKYEPVRFIPYLTIALNYRFGELNVLGYHVINLIVHLCASIMAWYLFIITCNTPAFKNSEIRKYSNIIAFFCALIFLTHPVQVESVTYVIQRTTSLAALFYISTLCLYVKAMTAGNKKKLRYYYAGALITGLLAMVSRESTVTLPLIILLYEICFLKNRHENHFRFIIPFFILMFLPPLLLHFGRIPEFSEMLSAWTTDKTPVGTSPLQYLLTQFRVIVTYIRLSFLPLNQNIDYDYPVAKTLFTLPVLASITLLISILYTAVRVFNKHKLLSFGIFWFFITLLPESSIIPIKDVIFEHRLYLPMIGFALVFVNVMYLIFRKDKIALFIILSAIIFCGSILTYKRNSVWKDEYTLWDDSIKKSPNKARPYNGRGLASYINGNIDQAIIDFNRALELDPENASYYSNRGTAYMDKGYMNQARADYKKALELDPNMAGIYNNLGNISRFTGDNDQAIDDFTKAIEINKNYIDAYNNRGIAYQNKGDFERAISDYTKTIELNPNYAPAYINRGNVHQSKGNFDKAITDYNHAIKINPNISEAYNNRGNAHINLNIVKQAYLDYNKAIELNPKYAEAYYNRGNLELNTGKIDESIIDYTKALEINPNYAAAYNNRGNAYKAKGNFDQATADYKTAVKINPSYTAR